VKDKVRNVTADICITLLSLQEAYWGVRNCMPLFFLTIPDTYAYKRTRIYIIWWTKIGWSGVRFPARASFFSLPQS